MSISSLPWSLGQHRVGICHQNLGPTGLKGCMSGSQVEQLSSGRQQFVGEAK